MAYLAHLRIACIFAWLCAPASAQPLPQSPSEQAVFFATCAGRFAAEETYWGRQRDISPHRATFETLLEAVLPAAKDFGMPKAHVSNATFHAWKTHAYLRNDANFAQDPQRRSKAQARLERDLAECTNLIL